jgi:PhzF family phenazine biosynthesis protein
MTTLPIMQVDAFTDEPFRGNPAGVCLLPKRADDTWMQAVAAEMNLSETAFAVRQEGNQFLLRWFTPTVEVPLCGHATLATAHILWEEKLVPSDEAIAFQTESGRLMAHRDSSWIRLNFPTLPLVESAEPDGLAEALGAQPLTVYQNKFPAFLVELESKEAVRGLRPVIARMNEARIHACIVTARDSSGEYDFVSRFFAPGVGIDEDPVTGGAHCSLAPYWAARLGKTELIGHQVSKRGGLVKVRVREDRVDILGQAVTVIRGHLAPLLQFAT